MISKEELIERAQILRAYEANCGIEHPTEDDLRFRLALDKKLALEWHLKDLRAMTITGPGQPPARPAAAPPAKK